MDAQGHDADVSATLGQDNSVVCWPTGIICSVTLTSPCVSDMQQQFLTLDDIKEGNNIDMVEYAGQVSKYKVQ